jgi:molecular chaperone DnaK (HSP70)
MADVADAPLGWYGSIGLWVVFLIVIKLVEARAVARAAGVRGFPRLCRIQVDLATAAAPLGLTARYIDIVVGYLRHLRAMAEAECGRALKRTVIGRPVFFVDDDAARDAKAQEKLALAARAAGFD